MHISACLDANREVKDSIAINVPAVSEDVYTVVVSPYAEMMLPFSICIRQSEIVVKTNIVDDDYFLLPHHHTETTTYLL